MERHGKTASFVSYIHYSKCHYWDTFLYCHVVNPHGTGVTVLFCQVLAVFLPSYWAVHSRWGPLLHPGRYSHLVGSLYEFGTSACSPELTLHLCFDTGLSDTRVTGTLCQ